VLLLQAGASVTIVGRDEERGLAIVREMSSFGGAAIHDFIPCDASLLSNSKAFAEQFAATHPGLDILVLTQGIAIMAGRTETSEGIDRKLALHYYSRVGFALNLLPFLQRSERGGVVLSVLSAGVHSAYTGYATDPELRISYSLKNAADAAGFYNDCAWDELSRQEEALATAESRKVVTFIHAAPGVVSTRWGQTDMPWLVRVSLRVLMPLMGKSIYDCGAVMVDPLLRPRTAAESGTGRASFVLMGESGAPASPTPLQNSARSVVWAATEAVLRRVGAWPSAPSTGTANTSADGSTGDS
jgi:NAD(P)-dependent dehydrogenase (short-subunit alcohol dehydrogenase family)